MSFITIDSSVFDLDDNKYRVLEVIGTGGFGQVFKIENSNNKTVWALKTLLSNISETKEVNGLINDARNAIKIDHKNVINYKYFHDGTHFQNLPPYIIMDYAEDGTFLELLESYKIKESFIKLDEIISFMNDLIDGIEAINNNIIHRDLKPANILIKDNFLKISDFGLSKLIDESTRSNTFKGFGSLAYMSPEVWESKKNTILMDIYSMGIIFYEICSLKNPYDIENYDLIKWREAHLYTNPVAPSTVNPEIPQIIDNLIMKMIQKNPIDRHQEWSSIQKELNSDGLDNRKNSKIVGDILKLINEKNQEESKLKEIVLKKNEEKNDYVKRVYSQFEKIIIHPLNEFVDDLNEGFTSRNGTIDIQISGDIISCQLQVHKLNDISINMQILHSDTHIRKVLFHDIFKVDRIIEEFGRPLFDKKEIMMWGSVKDSVGKGFNLILIEQESKGFGSWSAVLNKNSVGHNRRPRLPEPFPFVFEELERELPLTNSMHIYTSIVKNFDIDDIYSLLRNTL